MEGITTYFTILKLNDNGSQVPHQKTLIGKLDYKGRPRRKIQEGNWDTVAECVCFMNQGLC
jgi:hypothetical protein